MKKYKRNDKKENKYKWKEMTEISYSLKYLWKMMFNNCI